MPELPEVETTKRGIAPFVNKQQITNVVIRHSQLRWPIPRFIQAGLAGETVHNLTRRAKYLLFHCDSGTMILHLGMSGRVRMLDKDIAPGKHDHVDIHFTNGYYLRFTDPRRFGALLWTKENPEQHPLIKNIGPEPLSSKFDGEYLWQHARKRSVPIKTFIMNSHTVAGVGNIYATESLFTARIHPSKAAGKISRAKYDELANAIKAILRQAIKQGGTTLKDFRKSDGSPGYFSIALQVYGHTGKPCPTCGTTLTCLRIAQRSTVYCTTCQAA